MTAKWSDNTEFPVASSVSLTTTSIVGLVAGANGKFTPTVLQAALTKVGLVTITQPAAAATLTIANNKTLVISNSLTLAGTDSTTMTFPTTSATIARTDAGQTFTGTQAFGAVTATGALISGLTASQLVVTDGSKNLASSAVGTGVLTALGTNVGTAGSVVVNGGALGTPSSGTLTNCTGLPLSTGVTGALSWAINAQTGTSYTIDATDAGKLVTFNNAAAVAVTVPQATGSFTTGFSFSVQNLGAGLVTMTPTTSTVNLATTLIVPQGTGASYASDGTNWDAFTGGAGAVQLLCVPTVDGTCFGPATRSFVSGYTSSAVGDSVILDSSFKWQKTDANTASIYSGMLGIAMEVKATDAALLVALPGSIVYATAFPTFNNGPIYLSETAGALTQTAPTTTDAATRIVGYGVHADKMYFNPSNDFITHT